MTEGNHSDLGPELRALAQAIVDRLDPAVRAAAARAAEALRGPGRCQQVWCPVCALAALVSGEEHPMLTVIAEHSVALMTVIRAAADPQAAQAAPASQAPDAAGDAPATPAGPNASTNGSADGSGRGGYQHIPIVVEASESPEDCP